LTHEAIKRTLKSTPQFITRGIERKALKFTVFRT